MKFRIVEMNFFLPYMNECISCLIIYLFVYTERLRASGEHNADVVGVEVVVDESLDDGWELGLDQGVAGGLQVRQQQTKRLAQLNTRRSLFTWKDARLSTHTRRKGFKLGF